MKNNTQNSLSGKDNNRLSNATPIRKEETAAWSETKETSNPGKVSIPSQSNVSKGKEWVDNGSKL